MKRFLRAIYLIPSLWIAWFVYYCVRLRIKGATVFTDPNTGERIIKEWTRTGYVPIAPDVYGDGLHGLLTLVTIIWVALGVMKLLIRFFVRTVHEEKQRVKEEAK